jgi:surfactin synthase thioesterase subunit
VNQPVSLVCAPFAGSGAGFFQPWRAIAPAGVQIVPIRLPGRERRIRERPYGDVTLAAKGVLPDVLAQVGAGPVVLFGHSLGAVLAYELAHLLAATPEVDLRRLVVSGSPGPRTQRAERATGLPDDQFVERVAELAGYRNPALAEPEVRALLLPILRADVEMHEAYRPSFDSPLDVPVTAIRAKADALVSTEQTRQWAEATNRDFTMVEVAGEHMYLIDSPESVLRVVAESLGVG